MSLSWSHSPRSDRRQPRRLDRRRRLALEPLEGRQMLSTFAVTNTSDSGTNSLRWAITQSNLTAGPNTIDFNIPGSYQQTIDLQSALPTITSPVTIDGTSQPGYEGTPVIILNGAAAGAQTSALTVTASNSTVKGLAIDSFGGDGVVVSGGTNVVVTADVIGLTVPGSIGPLTVSFGNAPAGNGGDGVFIEGNASGVTVSGDVVSANSGDGIHVNNASSVLIAGDQVGTNLRATAALGNARNGIELDSATNATIGGTAAGSGDVVSGNFVGVVVDQSTGTLLEGTYIGTDVTGDVAIANSGDGVDVYASTGTTIGGSVAAARVVISGNSSGVDVDQSTGTLLEGAYIGTNVTGEAALGNNGVGIDLYSGSGTTIGGSAAADRVVISGNTGLGIDVDSTKGTLIEGAYIGTDATGETALANGGIGIDMVGATNTTIGGTAAASAVVISGNQGNGVDVVRSSGTLLEGAYIGTDATGDVAMGNQGYGLYLYSATDTTIGGTAAGSGVVISGNSRGVDVDQSTGTLLEGTYIGTNVTGTVAIANSGQGLNVYDASDTTIGGTVAAARVVISGNSSGVLVCQSTGTLVEGTYIGTNATGEAALANGGVGLNLDYATDTTIGGTTAGSRVVISGNTSIGIYASPATGTLIEGTYIGTDATGETTLANEGVGIDLNGATGTTIGGTTAGSAVVISGNTGNGVDVVRSPGTLVEGAYIGTDATGDVALGNKGNGLYLYSTTGTTIGGTVAGSAVVISGNGGCGVDITDAGTSDNVIEGDFIGTNAAGSAALPNGSDGVMIQGGATGNTIGGATASARDVISGNGVCGVYIMGQGSSGNVIAADFIGTNAAGSAAIPNAINGLDIVSGASHNTVGGIAVGSAYGPGDVISGNTYNGVVIAFTGASDNVVAGDFIGTNAAGAAALPNGSDGVVIQGGATGNTIGGTTTATRDVISGNGGWGVYLTDAGTSDNVVEGDFIGTNAGGTAALPNAINGLDIVSGASYNTVGGTAAGAGDVISGNSYNGVVIAFSGASYNGVVGDFIGTNAAGSAALPNGSDGVVIQGGASDNIIGGYSAADRDVISGNGGCGVVITDSGTTYNVVGADDIGLDATGTRAIPNGNAGVIIQSGASNNEVLSDVISANLDEGVLITGSGTNGNVVESDDIGTNAAGNAVVLYPGESYSNGIGVEVSYGPSGTLIEGNVIGGNNVGVEIYGNATSTSVLGNDIGTDVTGRLNLGNVVCGVYLYDTSGNTVEDDTIDDSEYGIVTIEADQNTIAYDTFSGNQDGNRLSLD